jgi:hypothetical protein
MIKENTESPGIKACICAMVSGLAADFSLLSASAVLKLPTYHFWTMARRD